MDLEDVAILIVCLLGCATGMFLTGVFAGLVVVGFRLVTGV